MSNVSLTQKNTTSWFSKVIKIWFVTAFFGQFIFALYICAQYFIKIFIGDISDWSQSSSGGMIEGDIIGNVGFVVHVLLALVITIGGPLQLIPFVRNNYPKFHRYNGRVYVISALIISTVGLYLIWVRGTVGDTLAHSMTSINGVIIIVAALATIRYAMLKQFDRHNDWAIRLFVAMSGVFFFRVFLNFWFIVSKGAGIDFETFTGLPLDIIGFCSYIGPQFLIEIYIRLRRSKNEWLKSTMTTFMLALILIFTIGILGAARIMWWPTVVK